MNMRERGSVASNLKSLLEHLLSEDIDEAAIAIAQAKAKGLALFIERSEPVLILYNPAVILNDIKTEMTEDSDEQDFNTCVQDGNGIVGAVKFQSSYVDRDAYEVKLIAAESKYGPMLYDILMSHVYPHFLMSDREEVSDSAQAVWDYYFTRRSDVEHRLTSATRITPDRDYEDEEEDEDFNNDSDNDFENSTDHAFRIKKPKSFTSLLNNHQIFIKAVEEALPHLFRDAQSEIEESLGGAAVVYWRDNV